MDPARPRKRASRSDALIDDSWRIDGDEASRFAPAGVTGDLWDVIAAPVLVAPGRPRVLILGHGAGSVTRIVRTLAPRAVVTGVDPSDEAWATAAAWGPAYLADRIVRGGAIDALGSFARRAERFDFVVDDAYLGRTKVLQPHEVRSMFAVLAPRGVLALNIANFGRNETPRWGDALRGVVGAAFASLSLSGALNRILVASDDPGEGAAFAARLAAAVAGNPFLVGLKKMSLRVRKGVDNLRRAK